MIMGRRRHLTDRCLLSFAIIGSLLVLYTLLALLNMAAGELSDIPHLLRVAANEKVIDTIVTTMGAGLATVIILLFLGTPLAYVLARTDFRGKGIVEAIIDIPLMLPHTVAGIMVYILFMRRGLIGAPLYEVGIVFEEAFLGIIVAMLFVSAPYFVDAVREGFEKVPVHLENVARTLGATRFQAFTRVVLPLSVRHIFNGSILAWGRAIGEFAAVVFIAYYPFVISTLIYNTFTTDGIKESTSVAFVMIVVCFAVFAGLRIIMKHVGRYDDRV